MPKKSFRLFQNYPNPFNPVTTIGYRLSTVSDVDLIVYDVAGQKVATLVSERQPAGNYTVKWNANNMAAGVYYYKIQAGNFNHVRKMILLK